jgi:hypothetical protein
MGKGTPVSSEIKWGGTEFLWFGKRLLAFAAKRKRNSDQLTICKYNNRPDGLTKCS